MAADDLDVAVVDYTRLLGREPAPCEPTDPGVRFVLRNTTLQLIERAGSDVAGSEPAAGVAALVFEQDDREEGAWLAPTETRGIPVGLVGPPEADAGLAEPVDDARPEQTVAALDHVVVSSGDLDAATRLYGERLGLRLALDRSFDARGIRIQFYRVGGTTVEVVGALPDTDRPEGGRRAFDAEADRFGGLAWEVEDVAAVHARLCAEGFDVSDLRVGHKPGTRVCTVRSRTHAVPTLLKGPDPG